MYTFRLEILTTLIVGSLLGMHRPVQFFGSLKLFSDIYNFIWFNSTCEGPSNYLAHNIPS